MHAAAYALVLFLHFWGEAERHRFEERVAALKAAGQPVRYEDLETPQVPDDKNAAVAFAKAAQMLAEQRANEPFSFLWPDPDLLEAETPEDLEARRSWLRSLKPYFDQVGEVTRRPLWHVDHEWKKGPDHKLPEFGWIQDACQYLHWRVALDPEDKGSATCAAEAVCLLMDLGDRCRSPFIIGYLVSRMPSSWYPAIFLRTACGSPSVSRPIRPGFDAALFRRLVDARLAKTSPGTGGLRTFLAEERVFTLWAVGALGAGTKTLIDEHLPLKGALLRSAAWRPLLYRDGNRALDLFEEAIALAETSPEEALRVARRLRGRYASKDPTLLLSGWALPTLTRTFEKYAELVAIQRLTRVVMALLEYRQKEGAWPESLDALGEMPLDPYSGKPFRYERFMDTGARVRAAKKIPDGTGWKDEWEALEEDNLAWTFKE